MPCKDSSVVQEKTAKIKNWVKNRLVELEQQNERLREQNLRCTTQLQMLKSFTERTKEWKYQHDRMTSTMSRSVTGSIMHTVDARTSDDSGLTSDDQMKNIDKMSRSTMETTRRMSTSSTPRVNRKGVRMRGQLNGEEEKDSSDSSPWEEKKGIGGPRIPKRLPPIERDSMNSSVDDYEFDCEEEIFDEIEDTPSTSRNVEYVNLSDFCLIRDDNNIYSDIVKSPIESAPKPPQHSKMKLWEYQLHEVADKCLSMGNDSYIPFTPPHSSSPALRLSNENRRSNHSKNSLNSPHHGMESISIRGSYSIEEGRSPLDIRTSLIATNDLNEKSGYWTLSNESRLRSLKRRFVVMKNGYIMFYRNNKIRDSEPLSRLSISEIKSISIVNEKNSSYSFQIETESGENTIYSTESERMTSEWVSAITSSIKDVTIRDMASRSSPLDSSISSFLIRVHCGHSKRFFASLIQHKLMFFRTSDYTVPSHYLLLSGAHISERDSPSSDEQSSSSDEQLDDRGRPSMMKKHQYSISIHIANEDPTYLILSSLEEKDKWMYFLRCASGDPSLKGTPFEVLLQRMLADGMPPGSILWKDLLLTNHDESPNETMMSIDKEYEKKAIEMAKACHLFVSVLMRPTGVQYHIDLAQNILQMAMTNEGIRNELYAQLIRMTQDGVPFALQGWKLLSLTLPLFAPKHYALLWLLRRHLYRSTQSSITENASMAGYCENVLERSLKMGGREESSSRIEVHSILTRDPSSTKFPHSISIRLPSGEYQVIELDGSTEVGQCLSSLCLKLGMRPALLSGYAIYIDDPNTQQLLLLKGKQKICDCLSVWEKKLRDVHRGRIPTESIPTLYLRQRHYWRHLESSETPIEKRFLIGRMGEEMNEGRFPLSPHLADHLLSLYAQLSFGDIGEDIKDDQFEFLINRFYPKKMIEVTSDRILRSTLHSNWNELKGSDENDCIRIILQVLRKWPLFGCHLHEGIDRLSNNRLVYIALHDSSIHILDRKHLTILRSIPYSRLHSFGEFQNDFMLTVERILPPDAHPEETSKERVTFSMNNNSIQELTIHLAEYIRCEKLVWKMSN